MASGDKTQAMRTLDAKGVAYTAKANDAGRKFDSAEEAAAGLLGLRPRRRIRRSR